MRPSKKDLIVDNAGLKTKNKELQKQLLQANKDCTQSNKDCAQGASKETLKLVKDFNQRSLMLIKSIDELDPIPGNTSEYPCHYKKDKAKMFLAGKGEEYMLVIKDEEKCFKMIIDILRQTEAVIKKIGGRYVIYKKRGQLEQKYSVYVQENECVE